MSPDDSLSGAFPLSTTTTTTTVEASASVSEDQEKNQEELEQHLVLFEKEPLESLTTTITTPSSSGTSSSANCRDDRTDETCEVLSSTSSSSSSSKSWSALHDEEMGVEEEEHEQQPKQNTVVDGDPLLPCTPEGKDSTTTSTILTEDNNIISEQNHHLLHDIMWLTICFAGIMASFVAYGILLEYATTGDRSLHERTFWGVFNRKILVFSECSLPLPRKILTRHIRFRFYLP
jgi:hypothetical protein